MRFNLAHKQFVDMGPSELSFGDVSLGNFTSMNLCRMENLRDDHKEFVEILIKSTEKLLTIKPIIDGVISKNKMEWIEKEGARIVSITFEVDK